MPSYVIVQSLGRIGETVEAILCDLNAAGFPDRQTDVPVRVRLVSEQVLCVDDEPRRVIWSVGGNGAVTFLVDGGKAVRNRVRRVALARASGLLQQLTSSLKPLAAESEEPELVAETLQLLFDWIARERERAMTAPRSIGADGARHDHAHAQ
jgi:hypothetical protein